MSEAGNLFDDPASVGRSRRPPPRSKGWSARRPIASSAASTCSPSRARRVSTRSVPIAAFLHAARLGIFELSWNVLCPGCGGVLDAGATLKSVNRGRVRLRALRRRLRADARRDGRGDVHREPARPADRGARSATNCPSANISGRSSGAPASTCPDDLEQRHATRSPSIRSSCRRARRRCCRCSCRPSSSSCSIRSPTARSSST